MSLYRASDSYYAEFTTENATTGAAQNADSLPVATANHNGTDDASFTLTVTNLDTGRYKVTGTVPAGYAARDRVSISVAASVNSVAGKGVVDYVTVIGANSLGDSAGDMTLTATEEYAIATAVSNVTVETGVDLLQALRYAAAALAGVLSGAGTTTVTISAIANAATTRITATVDANGNRTAVTLS